LQELHVIGRVVDDTDRPVAGANVTQWDSTRTTVSDSNGAFDLVIAVDARARSFWVTVEKAGFETSELARDIDAAGGTALRLHRIQSIAAGESTHLIIRPDDSACGHHWGYLCRRLRVRSGSAGTLAVKAVSDAANVGIPVGNVGFPQRLESHVSIPVTAGSEAAVEVGTGFPLGGPTNVTIDTVLR
jgi:hypothetical protein